MRKTTLLAAVAALFMVAAAFANTTDETTRTDTEVTDAAGFIMRDDDGATATHAATCNEANEVTADDAANQGAYHQS